MKKPDYMSKIVDVFFSIAIIICCIVMIFSFFVLVNNSDYLANVMDRLVDVYNRTQVSVTSDKTIHNKDLELDDQIYYMENLIEYTIKLQDIESKSTSSNVLTFIYTFLSGTLIGVATYFTKKSADSVKQIKENKELIADISKKTLYSNLCMYSQRTYSTIQIFSVSLDAAQNTIDLNSFVNKYVPRINEIIKEFDSFAKRNQHNIVTLDKEDKRNITEEINGTGTLIDNLEVPSGNNLIDDSKKEEWKDQLKNIKDSLK